MDAASSPLRVLSQNEVANRRRAGTSSVKKKTKQGGVDFSRKPAPMSFESPTTREDRGALRAGLLKQLEFRMEENEKKEAAHESVARENETLRKQCAEQAAIVEAALIALKKNDAVLTKALQSHQDQVAQLTAKCVLAEYNLSVELARSEEQKVAGELAGRRIEFLERQNDILALELENLDSAYKQELVSGCPATPERDPSSCLTHRTTSCFDISPLDRDSFNDELTQLPSQSLQDDDSATYQLDARAPHQVATRAVPFELQVQSGSGSPVSCSSKASFHTPASRWRSSTTKEARNQRRRQDEQSRSFSFDESFHTALCREDPLSSHKAPLSDEESSQGRPQGEHMIVKSQQHGHTVPPSPHQSFLTPVCDEPAGFRNEISLLPQSATSTLSCNQGKKISHIDQEKLVPVPPDESYHTAFSTPQTVSFAKLSLLVESCKSQGQKIEQAIGSKDTRPHKSLVPRAYPHIGTPNRIRGRARDIQARILKAREINERIGVLVSRITVNEAPSLEFSLDVSAHSSAAPELPEAPTTLTPVPRRASPSECGSEYYYTPAETADVLGPVSQFRTPSSLFSVVDDSGSTRESILYSRIIFACIIIWRVFFWPLMLLRNDYTPAFPDDDRFVRRNLFSKVTYQENSIMTDADLSDLPRELENDQTLVAGHSTEQNQICSQKRARKSTRRTKLSAAPVVANRQGRKRKWRRKMKVNLILSAQGL